MNNEDKKQRRLIEIDSMLKFLKLSMGYCRCYEDITRFEYDPVNECVIVYYEVYRGEDKSETFIHNINVACDSNAAMIHDVYDFCYKFFCLGGI